jgi:hypothetical protein
MILRTACPETMVGVPARTGLQTRHGDALHIHTPHGQALQNLRRHVMSGGFAGTAISVQNKLLLHS